MFHTSRPRLGAHATPATLIVATLVIALLSAACGSTNPSTTPSASTAVPTGAVPTSSPVPTPVATPTGSAPAASPSAAASGDPAADATYDAVETQVIAIRGLQPKRPVERQFIDEAELRVLITQQFDEQTPPAYLAANERLYKALGLIPAIRTCGT